MSAAERIMSQWEVAVGTLPDYEECRGAWLELVRFFKRYKSIVEGMERCQMADCQHRALVISSRPSFASAGRMDGPGSISSLKAILERLEGRFNAVIGGFWDIVTSLSVTGLQVLGYVGSL